MQGAWVQSLVGELRSCMSLGVAKKKKKKGQMALGYHPQSFWFSELEWGLKMCSFNQLSSDTDIAGSGSHFENHCFKTHIAFRQDGGWGDTVPQTGQKAHQNFQVWQVDQKHDSTPANTGGPSGQWCDVAKLFPFSCCLPNPLTVLAENTEMREWNQRSN